MYWYLATPYSKFPGGIGAAYNLACLETARLVRAGIPVFSPIAHTHGPAVIGGIDPLDHAVWLPADAPLMDAAGGLIMLRAESWQASFGMEQERPAFLAVGKPVVYMDPAPAPIPDRLKRAAYEWHRRKVAAANMRYDANHRPIERAAATSSAHGRVDVP